MVIRDEAQPYQAGILISRVTRAALCLSSKAHEKGKAYEGEREGDCPQTRK